MILITSIYFFLNAPDTFFHLPPETIFDSWWYPYVNFALLLSVMLLYLLFLKEIFIETNNIKWVSITLKYTMIAFPLVYITFAIFVYLKYTNDLIFYAAHLINGPYCALLIYHNRKTKSDHKLIIYGLLVTFISVVLTMLMTIEYNQGNYTYILQKYPLLYIRIGILVDIFLFQLFLMRHWVHQEKELATQNIKKQLEIMEYKNYVNHALHDDIGTSLSKINLRSYMALQKIKDPRYDVAKTLQSMNAEVLIMIDKIKNILNDHQNLKDIPWLEDIHTFAKEMCEFKNIELTWNAQAEGDLGLTYHQKYQIVLITKEAINNAVKYSACTQIEVSIIQKTKGVIAIISDNGLGFDINQAQFGNGLKNMKTRAENINGAIQYTSEINSGSQVELIVHA